MNSKKSIFLAVAVASLFGLVSSSALADDTAKDAKDAKTAAATTAAAPSAKEAKSRDYGYTFEDDPLNSNVQGTTGFVLKVRPPAARALLSKPRVSFVPEMLKSVEAL